MIIEIRILSNVGIPKEQIFHFKLRNKFVPIPSKQIWSRIRLWVLLGMQFLVLIWILNLGFSEECQNLCKSNRIWPPTTASADQPFQNRGNQFYRAQFLRLLEELLSIYLRRMSRNFVKEGQTWRAVGSMHGFHTLSTAEETEYSCFGP